MGNVAEGFYVRGLIFICVFPLLLYLPLPLPLPALSRSQVTPSMLILYRDGTILMIAGTNCLVARENPIAASAVLFGTEARMLAE